MEEHAIVKIRTAKNGKLYLIWQSPGNYKTLAITTGLYDDLEEFYEKVDAALEVGKDFRMYIDKDGDHRWRWPLRARGKTLVRITEGNTDFDHCQDMARLVVATLSHLRELVKR